MTVRVAATATSAVAAGLAVLAGAGGVTAGGGESAGRPSGGPGGVFVVAGDVVAGAPTADPAGPRVVSTLATRARFKRVADAAPLGGGAFLVADSGAHRVYRVSRRGTIRPFAGTGRPGSSGNGGAALRARLRAPEGLAVGRRGDVLIADSGSHVVRRVTRDGRIATVAGSGTAGSTGDGGAAARARLRRPLDVAALDGGGMLIADAGNDRIRRVSASGAITTVAGSRRGFGGDGGPATLARLDFPVAVATLPGGGFAIADLDNGRVRVVDRDGTIRSRFADRLGDPTDVLPSADGSLLVAQGDLGRVVRVRRDGTTSTPLGGRSGATLPGWSSRSQPVGLARDADGTLLVADAGLDAVHLVATRRPPRLAVRVSGPFGAEPGQAVRGRFVVTRRATLEVTLRRAGATLFRTRVAVAAGATRLELLERAEAGEYAIEVVARSSGATTTARGRLVVAERRIVHPERSARP